MCVQWNAEKKRKSERETAAELEWWKYTGIWIVYEIGQSELFANNTIFSIDDTQNSLCVCVCAFCNNAKGPISNKNFIKIDEQKSSAHLIFIYLMILRWTTPEIGFDKAAKITMSTYFPDTFLHFIFVRFLKCLLPRCRFALSLCLSLSILLWSLFLPLNRIHFSIECETYFVFVFSSIHFQIEMTIDEKVLSMDFNRTGKSQTSQTHIKSFRWNIQNEIKKIIFKWVLHTHECGKYQMHSE